jgi:hypothetical protein
MTANIMFGDPTSIAGFPRRPQQANALDYNLGQRFAGAIDSAW